MSSKAINHLSNYKLVANLDESFVEQSNDQKIVPGAWLVIGDWWLAAWLAGRGQTVTTNRQTLILNYSKLNATCSHAMQFSDHYVYRILTAYHCSLFRELLCNTAITISISK
jgi:hypothetical protein